LIASTNKKKVLSKDNLWKAFQLFDKVPLFVTYAQDSSGSISASELKQVLGIGKRFSESVWQQIIGEVDQNSDGQISFSEFEKMMNKFLD
jgi:Ca2+-binding EF-hand superfamily protein